VAHKPDLDGLLTTWQKLLRLQDWSIKVVSVRLHEMTAPDRAAEVLSLPQAKQALIRVLDPIDYQSPLGFPYDPEEALIHELLHLHLQPFDPEEGDELAGIAQEQAVNMIAAALLSLRRAIP